MTTILNARNKSWLLCLLFMTTMGCFSSGAKEKPQIHRFPGDISNAISPGKKYIVFNVDSEDEEDAKTLGGNHALFLQHTESEEQKKLYSYDRYVDVLWSPDGKKLLVNDHAGSDYSFPLVFLIETNEEPLHLQKALQQKMEERHNFFTNHHLYIVGTEWLDENRLTIKVHGYGDANPDGFVYWFEYSIGKEFKELD